MALYQRPGSKVWYVSLQDRSGKQIRRSTGTTERRLADEFENKLSNEIWREKKLGEKLHTWDEAAEMYLKARVKRKDIKSTVKRIRWLTDNGLRNLPLGQIDSGLLWQMVESKTRENALRGPIAKPLAPATKDLFYATVKAILHTAWELKWLESVPFVKLHNANNKRDRHITPAQAKRLLMELPQHHRMLVIFALATGQRQANVVGLRWSWIDLERRVVTIPSDEFKQGREHCYPLNKTAMAVLAEMSEKHAEFVFVFRRLREGSVRERRERRGFGDTPYIPMKRANCAAWKSALLRAGIENFTWHDLRHTWASLALQSGEVDMRRLQELGGWASMDMVARYSHLNVEHLRAAADAVDAVLDLPGVFPALPAPEDSSTISAQ